MPSTISALDARWLALPPAPTSRGLITQICVRPDLDQRAFPAELSLTRTHGAHGDRWARRTWMHLPDGRPDPRVQLAIANTTTLRFLQALTGQSHHPGDTLLVDLDLSMDNLPPGTRLRVGSAVIEVSDVENDACAKFAKHYGADIFAWIRAPHNRPRRHRGLFAQVIDDGIVRPGDSVLKLPTSSPTKTSDAGGISPGVASN